MPPATVMFFSISTQDSCAMNRLLKSNRCGFTLVEIMIVVAIIGMLTIIAVPSFMRARRSAENVDITATLRMCSMAFSFYELENGGYPDDAGPGVVPDGMEDAMVRMEWMISTRLGGQWDWDPNDSILGPTIVMYNVDVDSNRMIEIDAAFDDGNLHGGKLQALADGMSYGYGIE